jgi:hypothetical protein
LLNPFPTFSPAVAHILLVQTAAFILSTTHAPLQVMWNTKMLARGRRVNREFAFISYATPLEAARAVHWLDGCRLPDLEKDKNGITVEYENGEGEANTASASGIAAGVAVLAGGR